MSRAQGDNFRTWTNKGLNAYRARLDKKLDELSDEKNKVYQFGDYVIICTTAHMLENPNGGWKWDGWRVVGDEYRVSMYDAESVKYTGAARFAIDGWEVNGLPVLHKYVNTKDEANAKDEANDFFRMCKAYAIAG